MEILVKGIKATIGFIRPVLGDPSWRTKDHISVWLDLEVPLPMTGTVGFGVWLPAVSYSRPAFLDALTKSADKQATGIIEQCLKARQGALKEKERVAKLQALVSDLEKELAE